MVDTSLSFTQQQQALMFLDHVSLSSIFSQWLLLMMLTLHMSSNLNSKPRRTSHCLVQFLGDIGQPLHVEAYEVGGNDIDAICNGDKTNLHAVSR